MKVSRQGKWFTKEELLAIADTLQQMAKLRSRLLNQLNGRALVKCIDPLLSFRSAHRYYDKLRSALEDEWIRGGEELGPPNPFYGEVWIAATTEKYDAR